MPDSQTSATVLIASPFHEDCEALRRIFDASGERHWRIRFARTCPEAWMALHQENVDVLLAECDFPDGLGWKHLLDEVQSMGGFQPVIVTSRLADDCLWAEVLNLGAYDLLMKPFDGEETVRVLAMAMRQAQNARRAGERRPRLRHAVAGAVA
jgi:two-component system response regulator AtoC